jgi:hypothetical protein
MKVKERLPEMWKAKRKWERRYENIVEGINMIKVYLCMYGNVIMKPIIYIIYMLIKEHQCDTSN